MAEWWNGLSLVNQWFYGGAAFFSLFFVWQLLAVLIGMGGEDVDADVDADFGGRFDADVAGGDVDVDMEFDTSAEEFDVGDAAQSTAAFRLLSFRSILAFCTLFCWAGALAMNQGASRTASLVFAVFWGLVAMVLVALLFMFMRRMTETGTMNIATSLGTRGTVYYDIPVGGFGEVRATVSGTLTHLKARVAGGDALRAGTPVRITRILGPGAVEVTIEKSGAPADESEGSKGEGIA